MGGSAGGNNAQLFSLMSQYGGGGGKGPYAGMTPREAAMAAAKNQAKAAARNPGSFASALPILMAYGQAKMNAGGGGGGDGGGNPTDPTAPPTDQKSLYWQFPQYTQSWAFTPPEPTPYMYPQPFDPKKFGNPLNTKD